MNCPEIALKFYQNDILKQKSISLSCLPAFRNNLDALKRYFPFSFNVVMIEKNTQSVLEVT